MADVASSPVASTPVNTAPQSSNTPPQNGQPESGSKAHQPAESKPEIFEVNVNGRIVKMTKQELMSHASMGRAANEKFNEAKKLKSEYDRLSEMMKKNPIQALMDPALGLTKEQIRDAVEPWYHEEFIKSEQMTPEQKRIRELESIVEKTKKQEEELAARKKEEEQEKLTSTQREYLQNQILEALDQSGLPKTKNVVSRIAFYMRQNAENGWDAPMDFIIRQVKQERQSSFRDEFAGSTPEQIIELFGEDLIRKISRHHVDQLLAKRNAPQFEQKSETDDLGIKKGKRVSYSEVTDRLNAIRRGKL